MTTPERFPTVSTFGEDTLERMFLAVEKVRQRLQRAAAALDAAGVPYAIVGGNAVAAWVSKVDPGAARNTVDVDLLIDRKDSATVRIALEQAGFVYRHDKSIDMFLDGAHGRARDAVHLHFAGEKVKPDSLEPSPPLSVDASHQPYRLLELEPLVVVKLTSFRDKDRTHLRDLIEVGLVDESWIARLPATLAPRLQQLLDDLDG